MRKDVQQLKSTKSICDQRGNGNGVTCLIVYLVQASVFLKNFFKNSHVNNKKNQTFDFGDECVTVVKIVSLEDRIHGGI